MARACATCEWFEAADDPPDPEGIGELAMGQCRRYPPVIHVWDPHEDPDFVGDWPEVAVDDWCGEYQPRHPAAEHP